MYALYYTFTVYCFGFTTQSHHVQIIFQNAALPNVHKTKDFVGITQNITQADICKFIFRS